MPMKTFECKRCNKEYPCIIEYYYPCIIESHTSENSSMINTNDLNCIIKDGTEPEWEEIHRGVKRNLFKKLKPEETISSVLDPDALEITF